ncbi:MAG: hypothetical protein H6838_00125 [Planctomycetes bacterium]|nr:hypothetical protein [Planctomycetota bacterium]MCB9883860.1 hypothetical protein [Planctomycetota bacterium]
MRALLAAWLVTSLATVGAAQQVELETLVERLGSSDSRERSQSYTELMRRRDPAMVPLLARRAAGFPLAGQQFAVYLLQGQPIADTRPVYTRWLAGDQPFLRVAGGALLVRSGDRARLPALAAALTATPAEARSQAVSAIWGIDDEAVYAALRGYLSAAAPSGLVLQVLQQLQRQERNGSRATVTAAAALSTAGDLGVRAAALTYLVASGATEHAAALASLLAEHPEQFWSVTSLLDNAAKLPRQLVDATIAALDKPRSRGDVTRLAALLQKHAAQEVSSALRPLLTHAQAEIAAAALEALANVPGGLQTKDLTAMLRSDDVTARIVAANTLRRSDDLSGLPVLLELLPKAGAKKNDAAKALAGYRCREAMPTLIDLLADDNAQVRSTAWQGLQSALPNLFPYRRFDFARCGYSPAGGDQSAAIATLRTWWQGVQ